MTTGPVPRAETIEQLAAAVYPSFATGEYAKIVLTWEQGVPFDREEMVTIAWTE
jgi:hypothetical protein